MRLPHPGALLYDITSLNFALDLPNLCMPASFIWTSMKLLV